MQASHARRRTPHLALQLPSMTSLAGRNRRVRAPTVRPNPANRCGRRSQPYMLVVRRHACCSRRHARARSESQTPHLPQSLLSLRRATYLAAPLDRYRQAKYQLWTCPPKTSQRGPEGETGGVRALTQCHPEIGEGLLTISQYPLERRAQRLSGE